MGSRTYHDPLHGAIRLDRAVPAEALVIDLIDTAPFQRLRRIRQLGPAYLTFHGAESSRFTHSLGVLQLARQQLEAEVARVLAGPQQEPEPAELVQLLAVCEVLYGRRPRGHLLRVPAFAFGHGTILSAELREGLPGARALVQEWRSRHA
jgi:hypothetical protein